MRDAAVLLGCVVLLTGCTATASLVINTGQPPSTPVLAPPSEGRPPQPMITPAQALSEPETQRWRELASQQRVDIRRIALFSAAQLYAASRGYRLGPGATGDFETNFAKTAAEDIENLPVTERTMKLREVARNLARLIDQMILEAQRIPNYDKEHPGVIGEETLSPAKRYVCPLYPICR